MGHQTALSSTPIGGAPSPSAGPPTQLEATFLGVAAFGTAVTTVVVDSHTPLTVGLLVLELVPWALLAGRVRLPLWVLVPWVILPAAAIVTSADAGAPIFFGMKVTLWAASATGRWRPTLATVGAAAALPVLFDLVSPAGPNGPRVAYFLIGLTGSALGGALLHHQRRITAELRWSQSLLSAAAAADERRRIAREIHDVLAHSLTVVVLNVGAARKASRTHPDLVDEALGRVEQVGRQSLDAVRHIVGLLRADDGERVEPANDLHNVIDTHVAAGADVDFAINGDLATIGPIPAYALSRIVQEALANALRHAPGARVDGRLDVAADEVVLEIRNGAPRRAPLDRRGAHQGMGLLGMRERIEALGGTFSAGPCSDGGWQVTCAIPAPSIRMTAPSMPVTAR